MGTLLVRYRDTNAIRWGELEGNAPRQPNEVLSVLPLASHASNYFRHNIGFLIKRT